MKKIHNLTRSVKLAKKLHEEGKKLVLAGGFFDILHIGHIHFLQKAKLHGDHLMLLLESDETAKRLKGQNRPINSQENRARVLAALTSVDSIVLLPSFATNKAYDRLVLQVKPAIIATTIGDPYRKQKEKQAKSVGGKVVSIKNLPYHSTTRLAQLLSQQGL